uniref:NADH-ubiquinone oxidoreductase chain 1 n=1 Tax=Decipisagitta decipiens TaxID=366427 RepID=D3DKM1_9BILA|nr:NADH dehydrogenase subunit 1 [Decipisagitta decipiens]BAI68170.1 NADH dehydrogenase subunit 1 [Decipisagitta decipiens]
MLLVLVAVAFFTLMERKVLGYIQLRKGPNKPAIMGLFTPFADAIKLMTKENNVPFLSSKGLFFGVMFIIMLLPLTLWACLPNTSIHLSVAVIMILAIGSLSVYGILGSGWSANSKYAFLGSVRAVAQSISYEVTMTTVVIFHIFFLYYNMNYSIVGVCYISAMISLVLAVCILAEANRSPFDFAEGESELVSGFNTEFSSVLFVIIFMAEYMSILFMSFFCAMISFCSGIFSLMLFFFLISFLYVWARATLPRFRYDQLMYLSWKTLLPFSLFILGLFFFLFSISWLWKSLISS